jgi:hypothetical protein
MNVQYNQHKHKVNLTHCYTGTHGLNFGFCRRFDD